MSKEKNKNGRVIHIYKNKLYIARMTGQIENELAE